MRLNRIAPASRRSVCRAQFSEGHRTRGRRIINPTCRRKIALFPLSLPHTGIGPRPGRGRRDRRIERHAAWSRQLLNAASRSPARVVFRHLAILPNPDPQGTLERRCDGDFQEHGLLNPRGPVSIRRQLNGQAACLLPAITGLGSGPKRFGRSLLKGRPAHRRCSNRAGAIGASTRSRRTPTLACLFPRDVDGRPGPIPLRCPILASTQSGLQTRGWCASGRGSLVVVGSAAPDRSPV